jgi:DNA helicase-2/ATP-dependent DNA helicase PcrA
MIYVFQKDLAEIKSYAKSHKISLSQLAREALRMRMSQEYIDRLFTEINTDEKANQLLTDLCIDFKYPHYIPQGTCRNIVNLRYFGDGQITEESPWHAHRVDLWSSDEKLGKQLKAQGYNPRIRSRSNWRVGINRLQYDDIQEMAQKLSETANDAEIVTGAFLVDKGDSPLASKFSLMPASHLHPSMIVAIEKNGQIVEDEIIEVTHEPYNGMVYDFEVENLHNYIANGVVVHNSIYAWRGADYRNIRRFEQDFPDAHTVLLEQNYRSHQNILDVAMGVIDRARNPKTLFLIRTGMARLRRRPSGHATCRACCRDSRVRGAQQSERCTASCGTPRVPGPSTAAPAGQAGAEAHHA